jgi:hypothetical protein
MKSFKIKHIPAGREYTEFTSSVYYFSTLKNFLGKTQIKPQINNEFLAIPAETIDFDERYISWQKEFPEVSAVQQKR